MQKIIVIGAGLVGACLAFHLARQGARVTVLDAGLPAQGASGRSFGWINASFYLSTPHYHLRRAAMQAHQDLSRAVPGLHRMTGCLWFEEQGEALDRAEAALRDLGYPLERLSRAQIQAREPALTNPPETALYFPEEGAVEAGDLVPRLLSHPGIQRLTGLTAQLVVQGGRVIGVDTAQGRIPADQVVIAAGTGAPALLAPLGLTLPMLHRPGAILRTAPVPLRLSHILCSPDREIRQDDQGRLMAPTVASHQGDAGTGMPDPAQMERETLEALTRLLSLPDLRAESLTLAQRPVPGDGLPVAGRVPGTDGLWLAVMHSGITLAPLVGQLLAAEMTGGEEAMLLAPFRPDRLL